MKPDHSATKVHHKAATRKNIPANKNIVWRVEGGKSYDLQVEFSAGEVESNLKCRRDDRVSPRVVQFAVVNSDKPKSFSQSSADARSRRAGVNLGTGARHLSANERIGGDANLERRPVLNQVVDVLAKVDLDPNGFFVICHSGHNATSESGESSV